MTIGGFAAFRTRMNSIVKRPMQRSTSRRILLVCCLVWSLAHWATAGTQTAKIIGSAAITITPPAGFSEATNATERLRVVGEYTTPPTNRLLAFMVTDADSALIARGRAIAMDRYLSVQTIREFESRDLSQAQFAMVRETFRKDKADLLERSSRIAQRNLDEGGDLVRKHIANPTYSLKVGEVAPLKVFNDTSTSISMSALTKYALVLDGKTTDIPMVLSMTITLLKGKIVYLYAYSRHKSAADVEWAEAISRQWSVDLAKLN